jgi:hypothetical protein
MYAADERLGPEGYAVAVAAAGANDPLNATATSDLTDRRMLPKVMVWRLLRCPIGGKCVRSRRDISAGWVALASAHEWRLGQVESPAAATDCATPPASDAPGIWLGSAASALGRVSRILLAGRVGVWPRVGE